jgi:hypothetical protein
VEVNVDEINGPLWTRIMILTGCADQPRVVIPVALIR